MDLLNIEELEAMKSLVRTKMGKAKERVLVNWTAKRPDDISILSCLTGQLPP